MVQFKAAALTKQKTSSTPRSDAAAVIRRRRLPDAPVAAAQPVPPQPVPPQPATASPVEAAPALPVSLAGTVIDPNSLLFDVEWYRLTYPDVAAASLDAVQHFFDNGAREGRNPNPHFETLWYASANPDVAASKMNPFLHYVLYGAREGRKPRP